MDRYKGGILSWLGGKRGVEVETDGASERRRSVGNRIPVVSIKRLHALALVALSIFMTLPGSAQELQFDCGATANVDSDNDGFACLEGDVSWPDNVGNRSSVDNNALYHPGGIDICADGFDQNLYDGDAVCSDAFECVEIYDHPLVNNFSAPPPNIMLLIDNFAMYFSENSFSKIINPYDLPFHPHDYAREVPFFRWGDGRVVDDHFSTYEIYAEADALHIGAHWHEINKAWYNPHDTYLPPPDPDPDPDWEWDPASGLNTLYPRLSEVLDNDNNSLLLPRGGWQTTYTALGYLQTESTSTQISDNGAVLHHFAYPRDINGPHVRLRTSASYANIPNPALDSATRPSSGAIQTCPNYYNEVDYPESRRSLVTAAADKLMVTPHHGSTVAFLNKCEGFKYHGNGSITYGTGGDFSSGNINIARFTSVVLPPDYTDPAELEAILHFELSSKDGSAPTDYKGTNLSLWGAEWVVGNNTSTTPCDDPEFFLETVTTGVPRAVGTITAYTIADNDCTGWRDERETDDNVDKTGTLSIDVSTIVREIIGRNDWKEGDPITIVFKSNSTTDGEVDNFALHFRTPGTKMQARTYDEDFDYDLREIGSRHMGHAYTTQSEILKTHWASDSGKLRSPEAGLAWLPDYPKTGFYHLFVHIPPQANDPAAQYEIVNRDNVLLGTVEVENDPLNQYNTSDDLNKGNKARWVELVETAKLASGINGTQTPVTTLSLNAGDLMVAPRFGATSEDSATFRIGDDDQLYTVTGSTTTSLDFTPAITTDYDADTKIVFDKFWYFEADRDHFTMQLAAAAPGGADYITVTKTPADFTPEPGAVIQIGGDEEKYTVLAGSNANTLNIAVHRAYASDEVTGLQKKYPGNADIIYHHPRKQLQIHQIHHLAWQVVDDRDHYLTSTIEPLTYKHQKNSRKPIEDGPLWVVFEDFGQTVEVGDYIPIQGYDYKITKVERPTGQIKVTLVNDTDPAVVFDGLDLQRTDYISVRDTDTISYSGGLAEPGDFVKIGDMNGAYQISPGTEGNTLFIKHKFHARHILPHQQGSRVTILRPYLVVTDTHDIFDQPLGGLTTQVYRWRDLDSFSIDDELKISETNLSFDDGELVRVGRGESCGEYECLSEAQYDALLPRDNFVRSSGAVTASDDPEEESSTITISRDDLSDYQITGLFFSPANSYDEYRVISAAGNSLTFSPRLNANLAKNERLIFDTEIFVRTPVEEVWNMRNWLYYYYTARDRNYANVGSAVADARGANIGLYSLVDTTGRNDYFPLAGIYHDFGYDVDGARVVPQPVKLPNGLDKTQELLKELESLEFDMGYWYTMPMALGDIGRYFDQTDEDTFDNASGLVATTDNENMFYPQEATPEGSNFPWTPGSNNPWYTEKDGGSCQNSAVIFLGISETEKYGDYNIFEFDPVPGVYGETGISSAPNADGDDSSDYDGSQNPPDDADDAKKYYGDTEDNTYSDIAMHYYERDLNTNLPNKGKVTDYDQNPAQNLNFYAITQGQMAPLSGKDGLSCPPACQWPVDFIYEEEIDPPNGSGWQVYDKNNTIHEGLQKTRAGYDETDVLADLYHASVSGRGEFIAAQSNRDISDGLSRFITSIVDDSLSGAAAGITQTQVLKDDVQVYLASLKSDDWSGDVKAFELYSQEEYDLRKEELRLAGDEDALPEFLPGEPKPVARWQASLANRNRAHDDRVVISFRNAGASSGGIAFKVPTDPFNPSSTEISEDDLNDYFGLPTEASEGSDRTRNLINYLRGDDAQEAPVGTFRSRRGAVEDETVSPPSEVQGHFFLGDFVNSSPVLYTSGAGSVGDDSNARLFVGGNAGGLHVFNPNSGENGQQGGKEELFYIPSFVYPNLTELSDLRYDHKFFVDGPIYIAQLDDRNPNTVDTVLLTGGLNKGGKGYYALRVNQIISNASEDNAAAANIVAWEYPSELAATDGVRMTDNDSLMGYSYSPAYTVRSNDAVVESNGSTTEWMVVFGNGYNSSNGTAALIILGLNNDGSIRWRKELDTGFGGNEDSSRCNGLSAPALIDIDNDARVDFAFAGDLFGNMWKFDLRDPDHRNWEIYFQDAAGVPQPLFRAHGAYRNTTDGWVNTDQPITTQPEVMSASCAFGQSGYMVLFGTGRLLAQNENFDQSPNTFYGIWDMSPAFDTIDDDGNNPGRAKYLGALQPPIGESNRLDWQEDRILSALSGQSLLRQFVQLEGTNELDIRYRITTNHPDHQINWYNPGTGNGEHVGWYYELPAATERMVNNPRVADGIVSFISTAMTAPMCSSGFRSYIHALDACSGNRLNLPYFNINGDLLLNSGDLINIGTVDDEDIQVPVSAVSREGRLFMGSALAVGEDGGITLFTNSSGEIEPIVTKPEQLGITHWREIRD
jgi:Tfp pilus tip-associated adhesin PilY1